MTVGDNRATTLVSISSKTDDVGVSLDGESTSVNVVSGGSHDLLDPHIPHESTSIDVLSGGSLKVEDALVVLVRVIREAPC